MLESHESSNKTEAGPGAHRWLTITVCELVVRLSLRLGDFQPVPANKQCSEGTGSPTTVK